MNGGDRGAWALPSCLLAAIVAVALLPATATARDAEVRVFSSGNKSELIKLSLIHISEPTRPY